MDSKLPDLNSKFFGYQVIFNRLVRILDCKFLMLSTIPPTKILRDHIYNHVAEYCLICYNIVVFYDNQNSWIIFHYLTILFRLLELWNIWVRFKCLFLITKRISAMVKMFSGLFYFYPVDMWAFLTDLFSGFLVFNWHPSDIEAVIYHFDLFWWFARPHYPAVTNLVDPYKFLTLPMSLSNFFV